MNTGLIHKLYGAAASAALPIVAIALLASARGRRRLAERFGEWGDLGRVAWWLHGASVGEVQGLIPFIDQIRADSPGARILLTATSPTGLERGVSRVDITRLLPIDAPLVVRRALTRVSCDRVVISETELWPTLLLELLRADKPIHIINGRISDYTFGWYRRLSGVFLPLLQRCKSISVPDSEQYQRFVALGVDAGRLHITGHTKYDTAPRYSTKEDGICSTGSLREFFFPSIGGATPILVLGSIREGEEQVWFSALKRIWHAGAKLNVIVAPRHAERFGFFWEQLQELGQRVARWSSGDAGLRNDHNVLLLDTMGLLEQAYAASDLAFVGATLVDIGGHNPLEPAMYSVPVVVGPYTSVIREPVSRMRERGGIIEVRNSSDVYNWLCQVQSNKECLRDVGRAGFGVYSEYRGAADRVLAVIRASEAKGQ
jgi:3-deoxy-D-manno-octulosonic-acid transferase